MLTGKIGPGVAVVKDYDRTLPPVPVYAAELNQVWTNLIDNAVAAMGESGMLTLRTRRADDDVVVEVGDTGPGIPDDIKNRIFEPFFTTKPVGEGTGLGLDISWRIVVNRHHGDLSVDSAPGKTTFRVRLPITPPAEVSAAAASTPSPVSSTDNTVNTDNTVDTVDTASTVGTVSTVSTVSTATTQEGQPHD